MEVEINNKIDSKQSKDHFMNSVNSEEIWKLIEQLPTEQKLIIGKRLLGENRGLTVVFNGNGNGSNNVIQNSLVIQTSDSKELSDQLIEKIKNSSPEILDELLIAIAEQIKSHSEENSKVSSATQDLDLSS